MSDRLPSERDLAVLRYLRAHEHAPATAIAEAALGAPRTTFGRTLKLEQIERELADLATRNLIQATPNSGKTLYTLTRTGRQLLRDAALTQDPSNPPNSPQHPNPDIGSPTKIREHPTRGRAPFGP